jgi:AcrR family transcriptional regulator
MKTLTQMLGVGRATLYRWVGDREQLLSAVLAQLTDETWELAAREASGRGVERASGTIRRFMEMTAGFPPLRKFAQREPELALRVLMSHGGVVAERLRLGVSRAIAKDVPHGLGAPDSDIVDVMVQIGTALEWTPIVIGEEPEIDRAIELMRTILRTPG